MKIGQPLPQWSLKPIFNDDVPEVEDYKGKALLILFFNLDCVGCLGRAIPYANRLVYEHGDRIQVVGIHTIFNHKPYSLEQFEKVRDELYIRFPIYSDTPDRTTYSNYGAGGTPHWVLVDPEGKVVYTIFGSDPNNALLRLDLKMKEHLIVS
jgi:peroxiredoxin